MQWRFNLFASGFCWSKVKPASPLMAFSFYGVIVSRGSIVIFCAPFIRNSSCGSACVTWMSRCCSGCCAQVRIQELTQIYSDLFPLFTAFIHHCLVLINHCISLCLFAWLNSSYCKVFGKRQFLTLLVYST